VFTSIIFTNYSNIVHFIVQVNAFRERRALALTLNDTKTAVNKLHRMLNFLVAIIILVIWLLILEIATTKFLLFVSSQLVLVAFIFGNTCKTVFEAIIFLFVMHPFDVGDRCEIDATQVMFISLGVYRFCLLAMQTWSNFVPLPSFLLLISDGCRRDEHLDHRISEIR